MRSLRSNNKPTNRLDIADLWPRRHSTKLASTAIRILLTLPVLCTLIVTAAHPAQAQTQTVLYNFCSIESYGNCLDGATPLSGLTSYGGNWYGTTQLGGTGYQGSGYGTVFQLSSNGSGGWNESVLYNFCTQGGENCTDGAYPNGSVVFDTAGNLYGTTPQGGSSYCGGCGLVFELSPTGASWTETLLYTFCSQGLPCTTGVFPDGLFIDSADNLYGTDDEGVFELSPSGGSWTWKLISLNVVNSAGLAMDAAGNFFTLVPPGEAGAWTVFEVSPNGEGGWKTTALYSFPSTAVPSGEIAWGGPTLDQAGNIYLTATALFGKRNKPPALRGLVYKLTLGKSGEWTRKTVFTFTPANSEADGTVPWGGVVVDAAGNMYGTTRYGGAYGMGTVFEIMPPVGTSNKYQEKVLWNFNGTNGSAPQGGLILDSAGNLYGTTTAGGLYGGGVVFEVSP